MSQETREYAYTNPRAYRPYDPYSTSLQTYDTYTHPTYTPSYDPTAAYSQSHPTTLYTTHYTTQYSTPTLTTNPTASNLLTATPITRGTSGGSVGGGGGGGGVVGGLGNPLLSTVSPTNNPLLTSNQSGTSTNPIQRNNERLGYTYTR